MSAPNEVDQNSQTEPQNRHLESVQGAEHTEGGHGSEVQQQNQELSTEALQSFKATEEAKISEQLASEGYYADEYIWTEAGDGQYNVSYRAYADRSGVDAMLAAGDTGAAYERFMEMKFEDRQEFVSSAMYGGNYIDDQTLYFWDLTSREAAGLNTRTPANWDSPETTAWYQEGVARSTAVSAANQAAYDALTPTEKMLQKTLGLSGDQLAKAEMQLSGGMASDGSIDTGFSLAEIEKQNQNIMDAIARGDPRITTAGLASLSVFQTGAIKGALKSETIASEAALGNTAFNFSFSEVNGNITMAYDVKGAPVSVLDQWRNAIYGIPSGLKDVGNVLLNKNPVTTPHMAGHLTRVDSRVEPFTLQYTEGERKALMYSSLLGGAIVTAPIAAGVGAGVSASAAAAKLGFAIGAPIVLGQTVKTGFTFMREGVSWDAAKSSLLTPDEVFVFGTTGVISAGVTNMFLSGLNIPTSGPVSLTQRVARVGVRGSVGTVRGGVTEYALTGEVTSRNLALAAGISFGAAVAGELLQVGASRVGQRVIDRSFTRNVRTVTPDPSTRFTAWEPSRVDAFVMRVTGVRGPSDSVVSGRLFNQGLLGRGETYGVAMATTPRGGVQIIERLGGSRGLGYTPASMSSGVGGGVVSPSGGGGSVLAVAGGSVSRSLNSGISPLSSAGNALLGGVSTAVVGGNVAASNPFAVFIGNYDANVRPDPKPTIYDIRAAQYRAQALDRELAVFDRDLERLRDRVENWGKPNLAYEQSLVRLDAERAASNADLILRGRESIRARAESRNNPDAGLGQRQEQLFGERVAEIDRGLDAYREKLQARREGRPFAPATPSGTIREMMFNRDLERLTRDINRQLDMVNRDRVRRGERPAVFETELEEARRVVRPFAPAERSGRDSFWFGGRRASLLDSPIVEAFERPAVIRGDLRLIRTRPSSDLVEGEVLGSGRRPFVSYQDRSSAYWSLMLNLGRGERPTVTRRERVADGVFVPSLVGGRPRREVVVEDSPIPDIGSSLDGSPVVVDRDSPGRMPEPAPEFSPYPDSDSSPNMVLSPQPNALASLGVNNNWRWLPLGVDLDRHDRSRRPRTVKSKGKRQKRKYPVSTPKQMWDRMVKGVV